MRKMLIHLEVVSVEEAKKILEREKLLAKRNGKRKLVVKKSGTKPGEKLTPAKKMEVSAA